MAQGLDDLRASGRYVGPLSGIRNQIVERPPFRRLRLNVLETTLAHALQAKVKRIREIYVTARNDPAEGCADRVVPAGQTHDVHQGREEVRLATHGVDANRPVHTPRSPYEKWHAELLLIEVENGHEVLVVLAHRRPRVAKYHQHGALRVDGSLFEVVAGHARQYMVELKQTILQPSFGQWWSYLSMFLLGLYLGKWRILTEYCKHRAMARQAATAGLLLGVVVMTHATWEHLGGNPRSLSPPAAAALEALPALGATGFMLFYVYLVSEWSFTQRSKWLQTGFAAVGRTALSNYLLQSSLINVIFMGWGFLAYTKRLGPGG